MTDSLRPRLFLGRLPGRWLVGSAVIALGLMTGCSAPKGSGSSAIVPRFIPNYTASDVSAVQRACDGVGGAKAVRESGHSAMERSRPLRFNTTGLGTQQQAQLSACLSKQKTVQAFEQTNPDD